MKSAKMVNFMLVTFYSILLKFGILKALRNNGVHCSVKTVEPWKETSPLAGQRPIPTSNRKYARWVEVE